MEAGGLVAGTLATREPNIVVSCQRLSKITRVDLDLRYTSKEHLNAKPRHGPCPSCKLAVAIIGHRPQNWDRDDTGLSPLLFSAAPFILAQRGDGIYLLEGRPGHMEF